MNVPANQVPYDAPSADPFGGATGLPYFGQPTAGFFQQQQQQEPAYFGQPAKFTDDELRLFAANFEGTGLDVSQIFSTAGPSVAAAKTAVGPPKGGADKVATDEGAAGKAEAAVGGGESKTQEVQKAPKNSNTVQIVHDDVYNGQLPPS